jgi:hypothetical protein
MKVLTAAHVRVGWSLEVVVIGMVANGCGCIVCANRWYVYGRKVM